MASFRKRGDGWRAEIYRAGARESKTFDTRQQAADWAAMREAEIIAGEVSGTRHTLAVAIGKYLEAAVPLMRSQRSEVIRLGIIQRADPGIPGRKTLGDIPLRELGAAEISSWRDKRLKEVSPGTVLREMTTLRGVLEYARKDLEWLNRNPIADVRRPPEPPHRVRLVADAERDALVKKLGYSGAVETVQHECAVALLVALETAMRASEILGLTWDRVDLADQVARLELTKNGDRREVPLSRRAVELLGSMRGRRLRHVRALRDDGRLFHLDADSMGVIFRRAREDAAGDRELQVPNIASLHFHDTRATALTRLSKILSPLELARMLGHRDLSSLMIYYRETATSLAAKLG